MLRLNCFFKAREGQYDAALDAALALTAETLEKDKGCIAYDAFESATRPDVIMICETWEDEASLKAHMAAPHFAQYVGILQDLCEVKLEQFAFPQ